MNILETILNSKTGQALGVSLVFILFFWLAWEKLDEHTLGRITALEEDVAFFREHVKEEQLQRSTLFAAIKTHLGDISKGYHGYNRSGDREQKESQQ